MRCLWIARDIPFPQDAGDKIYSANLARAFAQAGAMVRFLGFAGEDTKAPQDWSVEWQAVPGAKRSTRAALFSTQPIAAAIHATEDYRRLLKRQLREPWDVIVFDSYGSGWALGLVKKIVATQASRPMFVHVSHNHEASLWRDMARNAQGALPRRVALWQNYWKTRAIENTLAREVDLVTAITEEDALKFAALGKEKRTVVLTPGFSGWMQRERIITHDTPRRVVIVGSFRWVVKQENLRQFIAAADERFHASGITLDVIGDVPDELLAELRPNTKATIFHGFVDSIKPHFETARIAIVPELIGGGFKLKFLDYLFARVPVATLTEAAAGLPQTIRNHLMCAADLPSLVDTIVRNIDLVDELNAHQTHAYQSAGALFQWRDRGSALRRELEMITQGALLARATHA